MTTQLYTPAAAMLRKLQAEAEKMNAEPYRATKPPLTWRDVWKWSKPTIVRGKRYCAGRITLSEDRKRYFADGFDCFPADYVGEAHTLSNIRETGWYADSFENAVIRAHVLKMRIKNRKAGKKELVYLAATDHSDWDGVTIYNDHHETETGAAHAANRYAEREAEQCREDDAKDQAENQIEELRDDIHRINLDTLPLIAEIKAHRDSYTPNVCQALRETIAEAMRDRSRKFKRIAKLQDNYWLAVE